MKSTEPARLAGLDTLRAVAILSVMAFHLNWRLPESFEVASKFGWMGVDLFFVLSGYLIGPQLFKPVQQGRSVAVMEFYRNRAYRILPSYLAVLAIYLVWPGWHEDTGMSPLWEFLTFTENLFADYSRNHAFSHVWSLCVEEHFYLLLPLIVWWLARRPALWKTVALMLSFFALGLCARSYELLHALRPLEHSEQGFGVKYIECIYYPTYARLDGLLAGVGLALIRVFRPVWWQAMIRRANGLLALGSVLVGCAIWMFLDRFDSLRGAAAVSVVIGFPLLSLGMAMWIPAAADARCWLGRVHVPGSRWIATLAFSLYLTHKEVAHVVHERLPRLAGERDWRAAVTYAVSCVGVAAVLYFVIERPFLQLRDRRRKIPVDLQALVEPAL
jgi:peptidoglycan/LPS O-acetylase OafA/YrhL